MMEAEGRQILAVTTAGTLSSKELNELFLPCQTPLLLSKIAVLVRIFGLTLGTTEFLLLTHKFLLAYDTVHNQNITQLGL